MKKTVSWARKILDVDIKYPCDSFEDYPIRKDKNGIPLISDCQRVDTGGVFMPNKEIKSLFRSLYYNTDGM